MTSTIFTSIGSFLDSSSNLLPWKVKLLFLESETSPFLHKKGLAVLKALANFNHDNGNVVVDDDDVDVDDDEDDDGDYGDDHDHDVDDDENDSSLRTCMQRAPHFLDNRSHRSLVSTLEHSDTL